MATHAGTKRHADDDGASCGPASGPVVRPLSKKQARRLRKQTPLEKLTLEYRHKIERCVRDGAAASALELYAQMKGEEGVVVPVYIYSLVLNACCENEDSAAFKAGAFRLYEDLKGRSATAGDGERRGNAVSEPMYSALVKLCSKAAEFAEAEEVLREMEAGGTPPKLRTFAPLLQAYSAAGDLAKCEWLQEKIAGHGLALGEPEFAALLRVCTQTGSADRFDVHLHELIEEVAQPGPEVWEALQGWFRSEAARVDGRTWTITEETVDARGVSSATGDQLASIELDAQAAEDLLEKVEQLVRADERRVPQWDEFKRWLAAADAFDVVIDAANVGYFNQNFAGGGFSYAQIEAMVAHFEAQGRRPLVVLHQRRTTDEQVPPSHRAVLADWRSSGRMFNCQIGNNDDWYWLYAAVWRGERTLLVSNDEMRDHHFQMIHPRSLARWKERHQARYTVSDQCSVRVDEPAPFSARPQRVGDAWHFPVRTAVEREPTTTQGGRKSVMTKGQSTVAEGETMVEGETTMVEGETNVTKGERESPMVASTASKASEASTASAASTASNPSADASLAWFCVRLSA